MPHLIKKLNQELPRHYEQFFKMSLDLCCIAGLDGYFRVVNPAWAKLLGYTLEELTAKPFVDFVHPDDKAKTIAEAAKLATGVDTVSFENRYLSKDGTYKWLSWRSTLSAADEIIYAVATDITAAKLATSKIDDQEQMLVHSSKLASLGEMAGGIAHEINTPLAIISMNSENALEELDETILDQDAVRKALSTIRDTATRIAHIIRGLKAFAKDGSGDPFAKASVAGIVDSTLSLCLQKFGVNGVTINWKKPEVDCKIDCREVPISQVLLNLLNNAYEAVSVLKDKWIQIEVVNLKDEVQIIVTDSGNGIEPKIQAKIMQPFFTTKAVGTGTGLGLSISTGIIQAHHGSLKLDSTSAHTRFVVTLPKQQPINMGFKSA